MKTPIVYYSFSGNNECLAQELQKRLNVCTGSDGQEAKIADELVRLIQKKPKIVMQLKINDLLPI
jgi:flavodoxin